MPGFWERDHTPEQEIKMQQTNGQVLGQPMSSHPIEAFVTVFIILSFLTVVTIIIFRKLKAYRLRHKNYVRKIETSSTWRLAKVIYWTVISVVALFLLLASDGYSGHPTFGAGILVGILAYPLYMLFQRLYLYVTGSKQ